MTRPVMLLLAGLYLAVPAAAQERGTVRGRVLDASTEAPVPTAAIRIVGTVLVTFADDSGRFELRNVPAGLRELSVERIGYVPRLIEVDVVGGVVVEVDVEIEPRAVAVGEVVVSATKRELGSMQSPVSIAVMAEEEVQLRAPGRVDEAVAYAPAVQFVGDQINIRGSSGFSRGTGSRVLLLVDGVPAISADAGVLNWDLAPLTEVRRIEVMKGAGSALWGTAALGGVVNVLTAPPPDHPLTRIRLRGGFWDDPPSEEWIWSNRTRGYGSVDLSHGRPIGPVDLWLRGGYYEDEGYIVNGDLRRINLATRLGLTGGGADTLQIFGSWAQEKYGNILVWCLRGQCEDPGGLAYQPARVPIQDQNDRTRSDKGLVYLTHRGHPGSTLSTFERLSFQRNDWVTDFGDDSVSAVSNRLGGELRVGWQPWSWMFFTLGGEGAFSDVDANLFGRHDVTDISAYAQVELGLASWLTLTAGAREDAQLVDGGSLSDPDASQLSPRFGIVIAPGPVTRIRASLGRGFRAPTVAELFTSTFVSGFLVVPNPGLQPERSWSGELGIQSLLTSWLSFDVAGFFYEFEDLIVADTVISGQSVIEIQFENTPKASIRGVEAIGRLSLFGDRLQGWASYTYLQTEDGTTGEPLPYRPETLFTSSGTLSLGGVELGGDYRHAAAFERVQVFDDPRIDQRVPMQVLDLRAAYHIGQQTIRFIVENALNYAYTTVERNLEPVRRATLSLDLTF